MGHLTQVTLCKLRELCERRPTRLLLLAAVALVGAMSWVVAASGTQPGQSYESAVSADSPVAYFPLNDTVGSSTIKDLAGSYTAENHGVTLGEQGPFGGTKAGFFATEATPNIYGSLPSNPLAGAKEFTAEGWLDWKKEPFYGEAIFAFAVSGSEYMYLTPGAYEGHKLTFEIHLANGSHASVTASKPKANMWEYIAVTETSSGTLTLYVDGEQAAQMTAAALSPASLETTSENYLGKAPNGIHQSLEGSLSNVAFYDRALSAGRIAAHYNAAEFPVDTEAPYITGTAKEGKELKGHTGTWTGKSPISYEYKWQRCESAGNCPTTVGTSASYTAQYADVGHRLRLVIHATNNAGESEATSAETEPIAGNAPKSTSPPIITGEAKDGKVLTVSTGEWSGSPALKYTYKWELCAGTCTAISGATASSYRVNTSQLGAKLRATVTDENVAGSASEASAQTAAIAPGPPVNGEAPSEKPAITGEAREGQTLTAGHGTWYGTPTITYTDYRWLSCTSNGCSTVADGPQATTYQPTADDVGDTIKLEVTAENGVGPAQAASQPTPTVAGNPPTPVEAQPPSIEGEAREGQTLKANPGGWSGTPPFTYTYEWQQCEALGEGCIAAGSGSTFHLSASQLGARMRVKVTAKGAVEPAGEATSKRTTVVLGNPPKNTEPPTIEGQDREGEALKANPGQWEGTTPIKYTYTWLRCEASSCPPIEGAAGETASSYTLTADDVHRTIEVEVKASNEAGEAEATSVATSEIQPGGGPAVAWGENLYGGVGTIYRSSREEWPTVAGEGLDDIVQVSDGTSTNLALRSDGTIASWGNNTHGSLGNDSFKSNWELGKSHFIVQKLIENEQTGKPEPVPLTGVKQVGADTSHAIALVGQGASSKVYAWGNNQYGALGDGRGQNGEASPVAVPVSGVSDVTAVTAGAGADYAVTSDGKVLAWGNNKEGQLAVEGWPSSCTERKTCETGAETPKQCKEHGTCGLSANNPQHKCWTETKWELCGKTPHYLVWEGTSKVEGVKQVVAGFGAAYALLQNKEVISWGDDQDGRLGQEHAAPTGDTKFTPPGHVLRLKPGSKTETEPLGEVVEISAGKNHVVVRLANNEVLGWGDDSKGELGEMENADICNSKHEEKCFEVARPVAGLQGRDQVSAIAAGGEYSLALIDGEVYAWGRNGDGELGDGESVGPDKCLTKGEEAEFAKKHEEDEGWAAAEETKAREEHEHGEITQAQLEAKLAEIQQKLHTKLTDLKKAEEHASPCDPTPQPVKMRGTEKEDEPGVWDAGSPLQGVTALAAAGTHAIVLKGPKSPEPHPVFSIASQQVGTETIGEMVVPRFKLAFEWEPFITRVVYRVFENPGNALAEGGEVSEACQTGEEREEEGTEPGGEEEAQECAEEAEGGEGGSGPPQSLSEPHIGHNGQGKSEGVQGEVYAGETVYANPGTWTGSEPFTYTYRWERCPLIGACTTVQAAEGEQTGEHGREYKVTSADVGSTLQVRVTANNSYENAEHEAVSGETTVVSVVTPMVKAEGAARKARGDQNKYKTHLAGETYEYVEEKEKPKVPLLEGVGYEFNLTLGPNVLTTVVVPPVGGS